MSHPHPIHHVVLDIEGTTCPVDFVSDVLFPYARTNLLPFLNSHHCEAPVSRLLQEVHDLLQQDPAPFAQALRSAAETADAQGDADLPTLCSYLDWLIQTDRKCTPLKDLQGQIWEEGYRKGDLMAPLYPDVPRALHRWQSQGIGLSVYSSGSVQAQQLLYGHTQTGDIRHLFDHWFDTRTGPKNDPGSYATIAAVLNVEPRNALFISDAISELTAADQAGMATIFSLRPGNPQRDPQQFASLQTFDELDF